ncbi:uncharacterized protein LOC134726927 [Mytilus trossulus]|uniref:uncharacterized protein LOC134726927 n=1 Tax=Mytilus trossulus TaxID=6551 RepID=UPI003005E5FD
MMFPILVVIFVECLTSSVSGTCCVPPVFQTEMDVTGGLINLQTNHKEFFDRRVHLYFDYHRKMTRTDTIVTLSENMTFTHTEIVDYHHGKTYKIDLGRCSVEKLTVPIQDQCIPNDAQLIAQRSIGPPDNNLEVQIWKYVIPSTNVTVVRSVTTPDCWPVSQIEYGTFEGGYTAMSYTTADISIHPYSESVMTRPKHCH